MQPRSPKTFTTRVASEGLLNVFKSLLLLGIAAVSTPIIIRTIGGANYGLLALAISVTGYVALAEFGIQTEVSRQVAKLGSTTRQVNESVAKGFWTLLFHASIAFLVLAGVFFSRRTLFHSLRPAEYHSFDTSFLILGVSFCVSLPGLACLGYLTGSGQVRLASSIQVVSRLLAASTSVLLVLLGHGAPGASAGLAVGMIFTSTLALVAVLAERGPACIRPPTQFRRMAKKSPENVTLFTWMAAMTLISGADPIVVSLTAHDDLGSYALASQLNILAILVLGAVFVPLVPALAARSTPNDQQMLATLHRLSTAGIFSLGTTLMFLAPNVLPLLGGASLGAAATSAGLLLLVATMIRQVPAPLALHALNSDQHKVTRAAAVVEALINLPASLMLGFRFGSIGVALGTLAGALSSVLFYAFAGFPRETLGSRNSRFWVASTLKATAALLPFVLLAVVLRSPSNLAPRLALVPVACLTLCFVALERNDRALLLSIPESMSPWRTPPAEQ